MSLRLARTGHAEVVVDAPPDAVWEVLSDVTRVGEWSHECHGAEWLDGARAAVSGARFRGRNRARGMVLWSRPCEIVTAEPARELSWRTEGPFPMRDSTMWRVRLEPEGTGTRIRQEYTVLTLPRPVEVLVAMMIPAHRDRAAALREDLLRLGRVSAGASRTR